MDEISFVKDNFSSTTKPRFMLTYNHVVRVKFEKESEVDMFKI